MFSYVRFMRGEFFWTFFIRDVKNGSSTSVIFSITFIYMMRNTAVFFCARFAQTSVPRTVPTVLNFE